MNCGHWVFFCNPCEMLMSDANHKLSESAPCNTIINTIPQGMSSVLSLVSPSSLFDSPSFRLLFLSLPTPLLLLSLSSLVTAASLASRET